MPAALASAPLAAAVAQRGGRLRLVAGEADEEPEGDQGRHQRGAAVGDQWQRDADDGQQGQHHADVDDHLAHQPDGDAGGHVAHERVGGVDRQPDGGVRDRPEQREHQQRPDQAELLAEHREDEVGVRLGQVAPLLLARGEALAEDAAAGHAEEAVAGLPAGALEVLERVDEAGQARTALGVGRGEVERHDPHRGQRDAEQARRHTDDPEHAEQDGEQHQGGAEVVLEDHQQRDQRDHGRHGQERVPRVVEQLLLLGVDVGGPQDDRELGDLGGLDRERPERQPVAVAVDGEPETGLGQGQQDDRDQHRGPGEQSQEPAVHPAGQPRGRKADHRPR